MRSIKLIVPLLLIGLCCGVVLVYGQGNPDPTRGFADHLLSPFASQPTLRGSLVPTIGKFPAPVAFAFSPYYTPVAQSHAEEAFNRWTAADGSVSFIYKADTLVGAVIVVQFVIRAQIGGLQGRTTQQQGYLLLQIAVDNPDAPPNFFQTKQQFQRVCTHEMGHALGINAHSPYAGDVMSINDNATEVSKSDIATLRVTYGGKFPR